MLQWKQSALSARARVSITTIKDFEMGHRDPRERSLVALKSAFLVAGIRFVGRKGIRQI
jgi:hypothetical protein